MTNNNWVLITGASSGIGEAFVELYALQNRNIILVSRDKKALNEVAKRVQQKSAIKTKVIACDLSAPKRVKQLCAQLDAEKLQIDVLINNAGFGDYDEVKDADAAKLAAMLNVNIAAVTHLAQWAAKHMAKRQSGGILNVASIAAFLPGPRMATYYASKAYVLSFTEALAYELRPYNINVSALCPGPTQSKFASTANVKGGLFARKLPTAEQVAKFGIRALERNKTVAVHGSSRLVLPLLRLVPRKVAVKIAARANS